MGIGNFWERGTYSEVYGHSVVTCAKTAELIVDLPFGLWTRVGLTKHKFNRIRPVAPTCPTILYRELRNKSSTVAEMGDRLATIVMG